MKKVILLIGIFLIAAGAAMAGKVPRWGVTNNVNVYIDSHPKAPLIQSAFNTWQSKSGNIIKFRYVNSKYYSTNANFIVHFTNIVDDEKEPGIANMETTTVGFYSRANITIPLRDRKGSPLNDRQIYGIALHEVGHALGLDHTKDKKDIMYEEYAYGQTAITKNDINNLINIYTKSKRGTKGPNSYIYPPELIKKKQPGSKVKSTVKNK